MRPILDSASPLSLEETRAYLEEIFEYPAEQVPGYARRLRDASLVHPHLIGTVRAWRKAVFVVPKVGQASRFLHRLATATERSPDFDTWLEGAIKAPAVAKRHTREMREAWQERRR